MAGDGDFGKFAGGERGGEEDFAIDVGGIGFGAGGSGGIDQNTKFFTDEGGGPFRGDFLLGGHGFAVAGFFHRG